MATQVRMNKQPLTRLITQAPQKASAALETLARLGQAYVMDSFGSEGSPSPAGAPPGIDTGELKNSIVVIPDGAFKRSIATDKDYAPPLELGSSKMDARPFMQPMAYWLERQVEATFEEFIE